jgi:hypothetical protein
MDLVVENFDDSGAMFVAAEQKIFEKTKKRLSKLGEMV